MRLNDIKTKKTFLSRELDKKNFLLLAMIGDKHIFKKTFFEINKNVFNDLWMFDLEAVKFCKQLLVELLSTNTVKDDLQSHDIQQTLKITLAYVQM